MNLQRCANGHFYDSDAFNSCPHCYKSSEGSLSDDPMTQMVSDYVFFGHGKGNRKYNSRFEKLDPNDRAFVLKYNEVRVFGDSSRVTAVAECTLPEGEEELLLIGFADDIREGSLSIRSDGVKYTNYTFVDFDASFGGDKGVEREYEALERRIANLKAYMEKAIRDSTSIEDFSRRQEEAEKALAELEKKMDQVEKKREEAAHPDFIKGLRLRIRPYSGGKCRLVVSYTTSAVRWRPLYRITGYTKKDEVQIGLCAVISSSLNLKEVKVVVSTGVDKSDWPSISKYVLTAGAITLNPVFREAGARRFDMPTMPTMEPMEAPALAMSFDEDLLREAVVEKASYDEEWSDYKQSREFSLKETISVGSAGERTVILENRIFSAKKKYLLTPRGAKKAFLFFESKEVGEYFENEMIRSDKGTVEVYLDDEFLRTSPLREFSLFRGGIYFSAFEGITGVRKVLESKRDRNIVTKRITEKEKYSIEIRNELESDAELTILDNIPVTEDEDIRIELKETSDATIDPETGIAGWEMKIGPNEKKKIEVEYTISYGKDVIVHVER